MGLSSVHIRSQGSRELIPARVSICSTGSLASVRREHLKEVCLSCGREYEVPRRKAGRCICISCQVVTKDCSNCGHTWKAKRYPRDAEGRLADNCPNCGTPYDGNKRKGIRVFSRASRRRLMRTIAQLSRKVLPVFVTLTYPDTYAYHREPQRWKADLRRFEHRFRRAFPGGSFIWRLEAVDRKSGERLGEVSPHYHLLVFGAQYAQLRAWVPGAWYEAVGTGDAEHLAAGTRVERVHSHRGVMSYASKAMGSTMSAELGKMCQAQGVNVGRWWGVVVREAFEALLSVVEVFELGEDAAIRLIRLFRRMIKAYSRDYASLTALIDGQWFKGRVPELAYPCERVKIFKASGRREGVPFWQWAYNTGRLVPGEG